MGDAYSVQKFIECYAKLVFAPFAKILLTISKMFCRILQGQFSTVIIFHEGNHIDGCLAVLCYRNIGLFLLKEYLEKVKRVGYPRNKRSAFVNDQLRDLPKHIKVVTPKRKFEKGAIFLQYNFLFQLQMTQAYRLKLSF